jgi:hypothetical protein
VTDELDLRASHAKRERVAASLREHCDAGVVTIWTLPILGGADIFALLGGADVWGVPRGAKELSQGGTAS